jgi:tetratricopeptide (TPR) repeat protein
MDAGERYREGGGAVTTRWVGMLRSGQLELLLDEAERFFSRRTTTTASTERAVARRGQALGVAAAACQAALGLRRWGQAVAWAERGLALFPHGQAHGVLFNDPAAGLLHFLCGTALIYTGDLYRAERMLTQFLTRCRPGGPLERFRGDACFHLGCLMRTLGRPQAERERFREAARAYGAEGRHRQVVACWYELAWSLLLDESPGEARPLLHAAEQGAARHGDAELHNDIRIAWTLWYQLTGDWRRSRTQCLELLALGGLSYRQKADLLWILGRCALSAGAPRQAAAYAEEACEHAAEAWWPPQMERIERLRHVIARRVST